MSDPTFIRQGTLFPVVLLSAPILAGCLTSKHGGNSKESLQEGVAAIVDCTAVSAQCARMSISRASSCAQLVTRHGQSPVTLRQCAVSNYRAALTNTPLGTDIAVEMHRDVLVGLADALKQQRDNDVDASGKRTVQLDIDKVIVELERTPGGAVYVRYFRVDSLMIASRNPAFGGEEACANICMAAAMFPANTVAAFPASRDEGDLNLRVNRLRSAITDYQLKRSCSTCPN